HLFTRRRLPLRGGFIARKQDEVELVDVAAVGLGADVEPAAVADLRVAGLHVEGDGRVWRVVAERVGEAGPLRAEQPRRREADDAEGEKNPAEREQRRKE